MKSFKIISFLCLLLGQILLYSQNPPLFSITVEGKTGLIDGSGSIFLSPEYDGVVYFQKDGFLAVKKEGKWALMNLEKNEITPYIFEYVGSSSGGIVLLKLKNEWVYYTSSGKPISIMKYYSGSAFSDGVAVVRVLSEMQNAYLSGIINTKGEYVVKPNYEIIGSSVNGFSWYNTGKEWGFFSTEGKKIFTLQPNDDDRYYTAVDLLTDFSEGLASVNINNKWGYINETGSFVIEPQFESAREFKNGLAAVQKDGKWGYITNDNRVIIPFSYYDALPFNRNSAVVTVTPEEMDEENYKPPTLALINKEGKYLLGPADMRIDDFNENTAIVTLNGENELTGMIDDSGNYIIKPGKSVLKNTSEGMIAFKENESWGFKDISGKTVIEPAYTEVWSFKNGLASVTSGKGKDKKTGYINKKGEVIWGLK